MDLANTYKRRSTSEAVLAAQVKGGGEVNQVLQRLLVQMKVEHECTNGPTPQFVLSEHKHLKVALTGEWVVIDSGNSPWKLSVRSDKDFREMYTPVINDPLWDSPTQVVEEELGLLIPKFTEADLLDLNVSMAEMFNAGWFQPNPSVEELLSVLSDELMRPEGQWIAIAALSLGAKHAGAFTTGQLIEADNSPLMDDLELTAADSEHHHA